jgi:hypothetical protein
MNEGQIKALGPGDLVWVRPLWRDWAPSGHSAVDIDSIAASRAYRHWHLAVDLASGADDEIRRGAAIQKLWNAADSRLRLLHTEYELADLRRTFVWDKKLDALGILARLGLARPLVLRELKKLRNSIEHADRGVPSAARVASYIDSVWYFLRSTDLYAAQRITSFEREVRGLHHSDFGFDQPGWLPVVSGRFPLGAVEVCPDPTTLPIALDRAPRLYEPNSVGLIGRVSESCGALEDLVRDYFFIGLPRGAR